MKKIKDYTWHDRKEIEFDLDDGNGYEHYKVDLDYWFIIEPEVNYKSVDDVYIRKIFKDDLEVYFVKQIDIKKEVKDEVINILEREL